MMITDETQQQQMPQRLVMAIANPIFPLVDSQLRAGKHISIDFLDHHAFLMDFQTELELFYRRYNVELIRAPEGFFYLRPKATTLISRSVLSELEMLVGKVLCYLYLSPERLAQQGIFSTQEVYEELLSLADESKLLKTINQRSSGSDLDKQKLAEKVRSAINRLRRLGMLYVVGEPNSGRFIISEAVFRFGAEIRASDDPLEAQIRLIREGEAANPDSLALAQQVKETENSGLVFDATELEEPMLEESNDDEEGTE